MINKLKINGEELNGIFVDSSFSFNKPGKVVSTFSVPGRSGSLVIDEGTFENVLITYPAYIKETQGLTFERIFKRIIDRLAPLTGYQRLETYWDPEHFRMGRPVIPQTPNAVRLNKDGFFDLSFDCKPQRFLTSGEKTLTFTASNTLHNPTEYPSKPLIRIYGNGSVTIGDTVITVSTNSGDYTDIDCDIMDCYRGSTNRNSAVTFTGNDFPTLKSGTSQIILGSGITRVDITPRWWEL